MAPDSPRAKRAVATRATILEKATALFREHGYQVVTVRMIAKAAGVSTGALWPHWTDKAALFREAAGRPPIPDDATAIAHLAVMRDLYMVAFDALPAGHVPSGPMVSAENLLRHYRVIQ